MPVYEIDIFILVNYWQHYIKYIIDKNKLKLNMLSKWDENL